MGDKIDLVSIIQRDVEKLKLSKLPNPIYGKKLFFFNECIGQKYGRNQLLGYLGAFCSFSELTNEIDICVIPYISSQSIINNEDDKITKELLSKLAVRDERTGNVSNSIPNTSILPEVFLIGYIKDHLLKNDEVKVKQFEMVYSKTLLPNKIVSLL